MKHALRVLFLSTALACGAPDDGPRWMAGVSGRLPLSALTLPGTHNSAALHEPVAGTAKCQDLPISSQLEAGVRFLDIRCRHVRDGFSIHHGPVYQRQDFTQVIASCAAFLAAHPSETMIMSVQREFSAEGNQLSFEQVFDAHTARDTRLWWLSSRIPTLDEARGKIVLLRRFMAASLPKGIDATVWPGNSVSPHGAQPHIQDRFVVKDSAAKWQDVLAQLEAARGGPAETLYLNFTSGYRPGLFGIPDITGVSSFINPKLRDHLSAAPGGRYGVIVMDFATRPVIELIYQKNSRND